MPETAISSEAFKQATQRSEKARIIGLLVVLAVLLLVVIVRTLAAETGEEVALYLRMAVVAVGLMAYEAVMYGVVRRSIASEQELPAWVWGLTLFVEMLVPTLAIFMLIGSSYMGPYQALVAPAGLLYFIFIILSTLRLSPMLSALTGVFAASGYLAAVAYAFSNHPPPDPSMGDFELPIYLTYATLLLIGGGIAGAVARQIRTHVHAALREAETQRQMERIEQDLSIARSIQQGLLPDEALEVEGFEIAGWSQPADETGGDYYDWQTLPNGQIAVTLADATGHGIGPALISAACRAYMRASLPTGQDLGAEMTRINKLLVEDLPADKFVTFVVAVLDPDTAQVQMLSAGHAPLFVYTAADGQVQSYDAHGIPFGVFAGFGYGEPQRIDLAPGDMIILITDGFIEWANAEDEDEEFGEERVKEVIQKTHHLPADEIISWLYAAVTEFAGGTEQQDDLTAVIIKRTPTDAS